MLRVLHVPDMVDIQSVIKRIILTIRISYRIIDGPIGKTHTKILALQMTKYSDGENNIYVYLRLSLFFF